ncbi:transglutaminase domain-containing protein [Cryobacterium sp. TMT1-21]|uniref:Transglutaminase domain-containing protein n=1 Tax=Cryobacterium shii TaxID=1259235 RepID=A0AAQ2C3P7_9MICO|nr:MULTISPECIES: transglutaminase domain-containing protein [Cryobacterium]TFC40974.1 transglutaminase domain-containing protein [Cryobacterium shii]TFD12451.1 transglutaminase domain-containing protein [Cryobacterium sp. TMT1-21]TFD35296.1 transglutaminase domain-containing protein [Cryobacterium sp. TMT2-10]
MSRLRSVPAQRLPARAWSDIAVLSALSLLGVLGFETSFGDYNFLLAGLGGLLVGTGIAVLAYLLRLGTLVSVLAAVLAYFLLGTPFTMPQQGLLLLFPSLASSAGLALGAVFGWADIVTLGTPVEAPYYMPVLPYFAAWLIALVGTMLASRWLPLRPRTVWRSSALLAGPVLLYLAGILMGTDEAYYAGIRGVAFAVIALIWLGWRRSQLATADRVGSSRLLRRKLVGTGTLILGTVLIGALAGAALAPVQAQRFVLREEIQPPFDPLQFPSPLAGFRQYTKTLADTPLFTVEGLQTGQLLRLASMDSYDGKLWNVAGVAGVAGSEGGQAGFRLVGRTIPDPPLVTSVAFSTVTVTGSGYADVWLPGVGYPTTVDFDDSKSSAEAENLRYNAGTGTAVLTSGVKNGYTYTTRAAVQQSYKDEDLEKVPVATVSLPAAENIPDVVVAKATEYTGGADTPIDKLRAIQKALKTQGFLSHGLASDGIPSRAGHGADRIDELFTRSQMVGDQEQYAAAMALMARSLNYPARVVMGFAPAVPDGATSVEVTGSDVTAWVEVAFEGVGWVPFFPTPDQTDVPQDQTPKPKSVPQPQVRQPPRSDNQSDDLLTAVEIDDTKKDDKDKAFTLPGWAWALGGIVGIPMLLILGPVLVIGALKGRRRRRRRTRGSGDTRVAGAWDEVTDGYAELGFQVPRGTTRRLIATEVESQLVGQAGPATGDIRLMPLAELCDHAVFNGEQIDDELVERSWNEALDSLHRAETSVGRLRRLFSRFRIRSRRDWSRVDLSK